MKVKMQHTATPPAPIDTLVDSKEPAVTTAPNKTPATTETPCNAAVFAAFQATVLRALLTHVHGDNTVANNNTKHRCVFIADERRLMSIAPTAPAATLPATKSI